MIEDSNRPEVRTGGFAACPAFLPCFSNKRNAVSSQARQKRIAILTKAAIFFLFL